MKKNSSIKKDTMLKTSVRAEGVEPTLKEPKSFVLTTTLRSE